MKTFLVPIDFSETSKNAAKYAARLAGQIENSNVILYNVSEPVTLMSLSEHSRSALSAKELDKLKSKIHSRGIISITCVAEEGSLIPNLVNYLANNEVDMIIMGTTGATNLKKVFMGSNTINVVKMVNTPVMIIPPTVKYHTIKNVLFTSDFKDVETSTPFHHLKKILNLFGAKLHIVNVDSEHYIELTDAYKKERMIMDENLGSYNPEFAFIRAFDFLEGVSTYIETKQIDAIVTVPKKHNFLAGLFQVSHTKKLGYNSKVPIFAIHPPVTAEGGIVMPS
jgi:nucleotide-binding universal stress UspA family protein